MKLMLEHFKEGVKGIVLNLEKLLDTILNTISQGMSIWMIILTTSEGTLQGAEEETR